MAADQGEHRRRGAIRRRGGTYQVRVYVGVDPVTGERVNLAGTASTQREAEKLLTRFLAEKDARRAATTKATVSTALHRWLDTLDVEAKTAHEYAGYVRRTIDPALGAVALSKLDAQAIESLYAQLRRCRRLCRGAPGLVDHRTTVEHECDDRCRPHTCRPMAPATIRTVHAVLSGALSMAVRYGWIASNPAEHAVKPRVGRPQPSAPTSDQAARLIDAAFAQDAEWGVLVWLVMVTGMRRSELAALRWEHVDLDRALVELRAGYVVISGQGGVEKDTKTHQMRFVRLDSATVEMLREHREACAAQLSSVGGTLGDRHFVFSADPAFEKPETPTPSPTATGAWRRSSASTPTSMRCATTAPPNSSRAASTCAPLPAASDTATAPRR